MARYGTKRRRRTRTAVLGTALVLGALGIEATGAAPPEGKGKGKPPETTAPVTSPSFGWDIARGLAPVSADAGYVLDGWGGVHEYGPAGSMPGAATVSQFWEGWDIARELDVIPGETATGGYVLDGWGGIHPFSVGEAAMPPGASGGPSFAGFDIARDIELVTTGGVVTGGYVLDGFGGVQSFAVGEGTAPPAATVTGYWSGWDIARDLVIVSDGTTVSGGYVLDGWGGIHPFAVEGGSMPPAPDASPYWSGWDIAESLEVFSDEGSEVSGLYVQDGFGGIHPVTVEGGVAQLAAASSGCPYFGDDLARDLAIFDTSAHALQHDGGVDACTVGKVKTKGKPQ